MSNFAVSNVAVAFVDLATFDELEAEYLCGGKERVTYFQRETRKTSWFSQIPVNLNKGSGQSQFGQEFSVTVSRSGDYLTHAWLRIELPTVELAESEWNWGGAASGDQEINLAVQTPAPGVDMYILDDSNLNPTLRVQNSTLTKLLGPSARIRWTKNLAHNLIQKLYLSFNELNAVEMTNQWLDFWSEFMLPNEKAASYNEMIGNTDRWNNPMKFYANNTSAAYEKFRYGYAAPGGVITLPVPLPFSKDTGSALPCAAIPYNEIRLHTVFRNWHDLLIVDYPFGRGSGVSGGPTLSPERLRARESYILQSLFATWIGKFEYSPDLLRVESQMNPRLITSSESTSNTLVRNWLNSISGSGASAQLTLQRAAQTEFTTFQTWATSGSRLSDAAVAATWQTEADKLTADISATGSGLTVGTAAGQYSVPLLLTALTGSNVVAPTNGVPTVAGAAATSYTRGYYVDVWNLLNEAATVHSSASFAVIGLGSSLNTANMLSRNGADTTYTAGAELAAKIAALPSDLTQVSFHLSDANATATLTNVYTVSKNATGTELTFVGGITGPTGTQTIGVGGTGLVQNYMYFTRANDTNYARRNMLSRVTSLGGFDNLVAFKAALDTAVITSQLSSVSSDFNHGTASRMSQINQYFAVRALETTGNQQYNASIFGIGSRANPTASWGSDLPVYGANGITAPGQGVNFNLLDAEGFRRLRNHANMFKGWAHASDFGVSEPPAVLKDFINEFSETVSLTSADASKLVNGRAPEIRNASWWANYAVVHHTERQQMGKQGRDMLIEQYQRHSAQTFNLSQKLSVDIRFAHAVRALFFAIQNTTHASSGSNYQTMTERVTYDGVDYNRSKVVSPVIDNVTLTYENTSRFGNMPSEYFTHMNPYLCSSKNNITPGLHMYSYSLDIRNPDPNGHTNYSRLNNVNLAIDASAVAQRADSGVSSATTPGTVAFSDHNQQYSLNSFSDLKNLGIVPSYNQLSNSYSGVFYALSHTILRVSGGCVGFPLL